MTPASDTVTMSKFIMSNETSSECEVLNQIIKTAVFQPPTFQSSHIMELASLVLNILIFILGLIGNSLVILVTLRMPRLKTPTHFLLANLAGADLFVCIFCILPRYWDLRSKIKGRGLPEWGDFLSELIFCRLNNYVQQFSLVASSVFLLLVTIERWIAIRRFIYATPQNNWIKISSICAWIFSIIFSLPCYWWNELKKMFGTQLVDDPALLAFHQCNITNLPEHFNTTLDSVCIGNKSFNIYFKVYMFISFSLFIGLSLTMTIFYGRIIHCLRVTLKAGSNPTNQPAAVTSSQGQGARIPLVITQYAIKSKGSQPASQSGLGGSMIRKGSGSGSCSSSGPDKSVCVPVSIHNVDEPTHSRSVHCCGCACPHNPMVNAELTRENEANHAVGAGCGGVTPGCATCHNCVAMADRKGPVSGSEACQVAVERRGDNHVVYFSTQSAAIGPTKCCAHCPCNESGFNNCNSRPNSSLSNMAQQHQNQINSQQIGLAVPQRTRQSPYPLSFAFRPTKQQHLHPPTLTPSCIHLQESQACCSTCWTKHQQNNGIVLEAAAHQLAGWAQQNNKSSTNGRSRQTTLAFERRVSREIFVSRLRNLCCCINCVGSFNPTSAMNSSVGETEISQQRHLYQDMQNNLNAQHLQIQVHHGCQYNCNNQELGNHANSRMWPPRWSKRQLEVRNKVIAERQRVVRLLATVVFLFIALTLPYQILMSYQILLPVKTIKLLDVHFFVFTLVTLQSALNPLLYVRLSKNFRISLRNFVRNCFQCRRTYTP